MEFLNIACIKIIVCIKTWSANELPVSLMTLLLFILTLPGVSRSVWIGRVDMCRLGGWAGARVSIGKIKLVLWLVSVLGVVLALGSGL